VFRHTAWPWIKDRWQWIASIAGALVVVLTVTLLVWYFFFATHKQSVTIESFSWVRQIEVEDFQARAKSGWDHPSDAYDISEDWRYHYSVQVYDGETCSGTGSSLTCSAHYHSKAVYDWWYEYTVDRWDHAEWLTTEAADHHPVWYGLELLVFDDTPVIGHRRLSGDRIEHYTVHFTTPKGKAYKSDAKEPQWAAVNIGDTVNLNLTNRDIISSVNWPVKP
jgi:hypothetical protein